VPERFQAGLFQAGLFQVKVPLARAAVSLTRRVQARRWAVAQGPARQAEGAQLQFLAVALRTPAAETAQALGRAQDPEKARGWTSHPWVKVQKLRQTSDAAPLLSGPSVRRASTSLFSRLQKRRDDAAGSCLLSRT
jgi:hypothetical protein